MTTKINLDKHFFNTHERIVAQNDAFKIISFKYSSSVEALKIINSRGYLIFLPFEGLMIWDAVFDGLDLKMANPFTQPYPGTKITDSYGAFQFHSGLLANGNPGPTDTHNPHGEFPLSSMDSSYIEISDDTVTIRSQKEYVKGFGFHYFAEPAVTLNAGQASFRITMTVQNLSKFEEMPLQYLVHLNYKFIKGAKITQNIPDDSFQLRTTVPEHIHPKSEWLKYTSSLNNEKILVNELNDTQHFNPEIVYFGDELNKITNIAKFRMIMDDQHQVKVEFNTKEFPNVTRWLMYNPDIQVAAFALPATCRTEGYTAAKEADTLIMLKPQEIRHFQVVTGLQD